MQWVPGAKRQEPEADHSPQPSSKVKKTWMHASTPSCAFIALCLVKNREQFLPPSPSKNVAYVHVLVTARLRCLVKVKESSQGAMLFHQVVSHCSSAARRLSHSTLTRRRRKVGRLFSSVNIVTSGDQRSLSLSEDSADCEAFNYTVFSSYVNLAPARYRKQSSSQSITVLTELALS
jgi:hypothetical protein